MHFQNWSLQDKWDEYIAWGDRQNWTLCPTQTPIRVSAEYSFNLEDGVGGISIKWHAQVSFIYYK